MKEENTVDNVCGCVLSGNDLPPIFLPSHPFIDVIDAPLTSKL